MYEFREDYSKEWQLDLLTEPCPSLESVDPTLPPAARSAARKTEGLKLALAKHGFDGLIAGIRRDEEPTRAKERVLLAAGRRRADGTSATRRPSSGITSMRRRRAARTCASIRFCIGPKRDVWAYTRREGIPIIPLYLARNGERYRSLGDADITLAGTTRNAGTIDEIVAELDVTKCLGTIGARNGPRIRGRVRTSARRRVPVKRGRMNPPVSIACNEHRRHVDALRQFRDDPQHRPHRHRRSCRPRKVDADRTPTARNRKPPGREAGEHQGDQRAARRRRSNGRSCSTLLQTERDQGITIDTSQIRLRTPSARHRADRRARARRIPAQHDHRRGAGRRGDPDRRRAPKAFATRHGGTATCCICSAFVRSRW